MFIKFINRFFLSIILLFSIQNKLYTADIQMDDEAVGEVQRLSILADLSGFDEGPISCSPAISQFSPEAHELLEVSSPVVEDLPNFVEIKRLNNPNIIFPYDQGKIEDDSLYLNLNSINPITRKTFKEDIADKETEIFVVAMVKYKTGSEKHNLSFFNAFDLNKLCKERHMSLSDLKNKKIFESDKYKIKDIYYYMLNPLTQEEFILIGNNHDLQEEHSIINNILSAHENKYNYLFLGMFYEFNEANRNPDLALFFYKLSPDSVLKYYMLYWSYLKTQPIIVDKLYKKVMKSKNFDELFNFAIKLINRNNGHWDLTERRTNIRALNILSQLSSAGYQKVRVIDLNHLKTMI